MVLVIASLGILKFWLGWVSSVLLSAFLLCLSSMLPSFAARAILSRECPHPSLHKPMRTREEISASSNQVSPIDAEPAQLTRWQMFSKAATHGMDVDIHKIVRTEDKIHESASSSSLVWSMLLATCRSSWPFVSSSLTVPLSSDTWQVRWPPSRTCTRRVSSRRMSSLGMMSHRSGHLRIQCHHTHGSEAREADTHQRICNRACHSLRDHDRFSVWFAHFVQPVHHRSHNRSGSGRGIEGVHWTQFLKQFASWVATLFVSGAVDPSSMRFTTHCLWFQITASSHTHKILFSRS
ncbi:hypothetical protein MPTK2_4g22260 [Marchantia polymorpha subsp. ruderalis]